MQSPAYFIPLFEKNGFITKLDQYVWDRACAVLREWEDKGYPPLSVSVNVSRADIYNADIADILLNTIRRHRLPPSRQSAARNGACDCNRLPIPRTTPAP